MFHFQKMIKKVSVMLLIFFISGCLNNQTKEKAEIPEPSHYPACLVENILFLKLPSELKKSIGSPGFDEIFMVVDRDTNYLPKCNGGIRGRYAIYFYDMAKNTMHEKGADSIAIEDNKYLAEALKLFGDKRKRLPRDYLEINLMDNWLEKIKAEKVLFVHSGNKKWEFRVTIINFK